MPGIHLINSGASVSESHLSCTTCPHALFYDTPVYKFTNKTGTTLVRAAPINAMGTIARGEIGWPTWLRVREHSPLPGSLWPWHYVMIKLMPRRLVKIRECFFLRQLGV